MKIAALCLLLASGVAAAGGPKDLDAVDGFRDAKFGLSVAALAGTPLAAGQSELNCYSRPNDELKFGTAELASIEYCFRNDGLTRIVLNAAGTANSEKLLKSLNAAYGFGRRSESDAPAMVFSWEGRKAFIIYRTDENFTAARVSISSVASLEKLAEDRKSGAGQGN